MASSVKGNLNFTPQDFGFNGPKTLSVDISGQLRVGGTVKVSSDIDSRQISDRFEKATRELAATLDGILRDAITANVWRTIDGLDDIVDSGALLESQAVISSKASRISISYDVPYAALVHYGGYIMPYGNMDSRKVYLPARPWVAEVLNGNYNEFNIAGTYATIVRRLLSRYS